jgi:hypothetical protein
VREQVESQKKLCKRLETLAVHLRAAGNVPADEFLGTIEEIRMLETLQEKYFTPEQRDSMKAARESLGQERLEQGQEEWAEVIALVRAEMDKGTDPSSPQVQSLAKRWNELVHLSTGGDAGIAENIKRLWEEQGDALAAQFGAKYDSRPVWGYITKAIEVSKASS